MYTQQLLRMALAILLTATTAFPVVAGGLICFDAKGTNPSKADTLRVTTMIREQVAVTTTTQIFRNTTSAPGSPMYGFLVPPTAMVTSMRWKVKDIWYKASIKSADTSSTLQPATQTPSAFNSMFSGVPFTFTIKDTILPAEMLIVELTYVELLPYTGRMVQYSYKPTAPPSDPVISLDAWSIDIRSGRSFSDVNVVPRPRNTETQTDTSIVFNETMVMSNQNMFSVSYKPEFTAMTMNVLSTKPAHEDGYALMLAVPKTLDSDSDVMPNRITFVIDHSGSMESTRMKVAKDAAARCVQGLSTGDIFNVIQFDDRIDAWSTEHQLATPTNIASAVGYINNIASRGGTNIMAALTKALSFHAADAYVNVIIFLTDGQASINHALLKAANTSGTRVFVFGIGFGINAMELQRIGNDHSGATMLVEQESQVVPAVTSLFEMIKDPVIKNPRISCSPNVVYDIYPSVVPDIYQGQQLVLVGRYKTPGDVIVTVDGTNHQGSVSYPYAAHLTDDPNINVFVAKIWAKYRIQMLLEWMKNEPPTSSRYKEWREEVVRLGTTYGIVTPFTSLVDNGTQDNGSQDGTTSVTHDELNIARNRCSISPNPVSDNTTIRIDLGELERKHVRIELVDMSGRVVRVFYEDDYAAELIELTWNATDSNGALVPSGMYQLIINIDGLRSATTINVVR